MSKIVKELLNGRRTVLQAKYKMKLGYDIATLSMEDKVGYELLINAIQKGNGRKKLDYSEI